MKAVGLAPEGKFPDGLEGRKAFLEVEYQLGGRFFVEQDVRELVDTAVVGKGLDENTVAEAPARAFAFDVYRHTYEGSDTGTQGRVVFDLGREKVGGRKFLPGARAFTLAEVEDLHRGGEGGLDTLISNMRGNGWDRVVRTRVGNWFQIHDTDEILP